MSNPSANSEGTRVFLSSILPSPLLSRRPQRPHVTLTFAQSLDGCIAGTGGKQLALSGKESLVMTHWMRTMHDAILVGIGTVMNDDPQLNARHLPPSDVPYNLPRPVIMDTELRFPLESKLLKNYQQGKGRRPWIICSNASSVDKESRRKLLEKAGARVVTISQSNHGLSIDGLLETLYTMGIKSLMVEGGQRIIASFLSEQDQGGIPIVDVIIITVAPTLVGATGIGALPKRLVHVPKLDHLVSMQFGRDTVVACNIPSQ